MDSVNISTENHIATITFFNPPHNALPGTVLAALADAIGATGKDPEVRVIVLQSGGDRTFCAGASFDELMAVNDEASGKRFFMGFANVINACRTCPKIILGRVQGKAVGGGVGIAAAVDFCMATKFADIRLSELALGIGPFVVGPAVERKIGLSAFSQLSINATEWKSAEWAREQGLYAEVFENAEEMDIHLGILSKVLAGSSPEAMGALKQVFWEKYTDWDVLLEERAAISGKLVLSDFTREAIESFRNRT